jgi:hypothetical protein
MLFQAGMRVVNQWSYDIPEMQYVHNRTGRTGLYVDMKASNRQLYMGKGRFVSRYESFKQTDIHVNFYNTKTSK